MRTRVRKVAQTIEEKQGYDKRPLGAIELKKIVWIPVLVGVLTMILVISMLYVIHEAGEGEGKAIESIDTFYYDDSSEEIQELMMEGDITEEEARKLLKERHKAEVLDENGNVKEAETRADGKDKTEELLDDSLNK